MVGDAIPEVERTDEAGRVVVGGIEWAMGYSFMGGTNFSEALDARKCLPVDSRSARVPSHVLFITDGDDYSFRDVVSLDGSVVHCVAYGRSVKLATLQRFGTRVTHVTNKEALLDLLMTFASDLVEMEGAQCEVDVGGESLPAFIVQRGDGALCASVAVQVEEGTVVKLRFRGTEYTATALGGGAPPDEETVVAQILTSDESQLRSVRATIGAMEGRSPRLERVLHHLDRYLLGNPDAAAPLRSMAALVVGAVSRTSRKNGAKMRQLVEGEEEALRVACVEFEARSTRRTRWASRGRWSTRR